MARSDPRLTNGRVSILNVPLLTAERLRASLLLLHAPTPVVQGIVECDLPVVQNGEPPALRKISIALVVLPTAGAWAAQFSGPPGIAWAGGNLRPGKASVNDGVSPRFAASTLEKRILVRVSVPFVGILTSFGWPAANVVRKWATFLG